LRAAVLNGSNLTAAKRRLRTQASALGYMTTTDPGLIVLADGKTLNALVDGPKWRVRLSRVTRNVRLVSRVWIPAHMALDTDDVRSLGVAISRVRLDGRELDSDAPCLSNGWHAPEPDWRWTDGDAWIETCDARELAFELMMTGHYWRNDVDRRFARRSM
jgi:hypothetical protein